MGCEPGNLNPQEMTEKIDIKQTTSAKCRNGIAHRHSGNKIPVSLVLLYNYLTRRFF